MALGTCAAYGGVPGDAQQPHRRDGPARLPRPPLRDAARSCRSSTCPAARCSRTRSPRRCSASRSSSRASRPPTELDDQGRPLLAVRADRPRDVRPRRVSPSRAASPRRSPTTARCLAKLGCAGPVAKCNVPARGWVNGVGGCPNVGGICIACTMPGLPRPLPAVHGQRPVHASEHVRQPLPLRPRPAPLPRAQHAQAVALGRLTVSCRQLPRPVASPRGRSSSRRASRCSRDRRSA